MHLAGVSKTQPRPRPARCQHIRRHAGALRFREALARHVQFHVRVFHSKETAMAVKEWVTVHTVADPVSAEIVKNALEADGIRCNLEGENQAAETGLIALAIKVQVPAKDAELARKIVQKHERHKSVEQAYEKG